MTDAIEARLKLLNLGSYKRKSMKHEVECSVRVSMNENDIEELKAILGENRWELFDINSLNSCVVCEDHCVEGILAIEEILFIPNKNNSSDNSNRFLLELPRICCHECALDFAQRQATPIAETSLRSLGQAFKEFEDKKSKVNDRENNNNSNNQQVSPSSEAERDPFDDGFLICTQLVKTGGADQGGLQVGDVFVEFAHYTKQRFPGLKSVANLVRRSAGKEIPVVVWRKLEVNSSKDDNNTGGRTIFQKLALKLKPLQSHDADGGGVLGAVINSYPLPEMRN